MVEDMAADDEDTDLKLSQYLLAFDVFPDVEHTGASMIATVVTLSCM